MQVRSLGFRSVRGSIVIVLFYGCAQAAEMSSIKSYQLGLGPCLSVRQKILAACQEILIDSSEVVTGSCHFNFSIETN